MKKAICLYLGCVFLFVGCTGGISFIPKTMTIGMFNFKKYSDKGFLFTPHSYLGDYESIGLVSVMLSPSAKINKINTGNKNSDGSPIFKKVWNIDKINVDEALDSLYFLANKLNANAIVDLEIKEISQSYNDINSDVPQVTIFGYKVDGFAIKRLGAFTHGQISDSIPNSPIIQE
jgi:hypothetical protein